MNDSKPHAILGWVSIIFGIISIVGIHVVFIVLGYYEVSGQIALIENTGSGTALAITFFASLCLSIFGLGFGIGGIFQTTRSKIIPGIGILLCVFPLFITIVLFVIGSYDIDLDKYF